MTSAADRAAIVAGAWTTIRAGSKSFASASRLFDPATRERAWLLYAWCRACDDYADGQVLGHKAPLPESGGAFSAIDHIQSQTAFALSGRDTGELPFDALRIVAAECAIPHAFIRDHLDGFAMDARGWRPRTEEDLLQYCYHVAGAVGCMMAVLMGVDPADADTLDRACDLGLAFQLANIARDLGEDDAIGRCYLPLDWLAEFDIPPGEHMRPHYRPRMAIAAKRLSLLAERHESSARTGAARLPFRARWAVLSAANIYGAIGREVAKRGAQAWDRRVVIGKAEKLRHVAAALKEARFPGRGGEVSRDGLWTRPRA
ncbi:phytoene/squalene synthase family protein [Allosphingosinicella flava]|uniref:Phytoene/squalene synthase family protein n=1 Tax=Allosphingosinicella flava TaxID=2771430 RepID=A0A7T2GIJ6_9SPHN|nr:phytoene/squalene synthase family protein [Sphingosinicella flava]QPQ54515.1 phytoene/squalene synthase family protein [Sphingosinicella flava]